MWEQAYQYRSFEHFKRETFSVIAEIAEQMDGPIRMADVSCGPAVLDGILLTRLGDKIRELHLLDVDSGLLELAKESLSEFSSDLATYVFDLNLPTHYPHLTGLNLVVSTNAIFHATGDLLPNLYGWCHSVLAENGVLINHQAFGPFCQGFDQELARLCPSLQQKGVWDDLDTELARRSLSVQRSSPHDMPGSVGAYAGLSLTVQEHLEILRSTGFVAGEIWRKGTSAMIMAVKEPTPTIAC
ncbi:MAG: class I SAM-dependent methyltransferase [Lentisphaerae bacterium]|jgi:hypothetical protein|nr:class I SAM-dependent methyltransferase [Lentisphaerota bacterium]MBT4822040.1 class I SAM-dependent methyltransferase [Lentisphaerota bacterium]MBT5605421.1 class I SAM-dependent methyltransferase [Lentisphaerota bacterium]MBT7060811.1 class I SAM-dependent methyltransferase [Lentisphaerota bacterium]MBT7846237.1 class I SAM-dependent methyltransferase [Lentisphaerota bacterium]